MFSTDESIYYSRQILLQDFGQDAQNKLKNSHVFVVGAGGLGCPALLYLAGAGVGTITIADNDKVQVNNLHRQVLFSMDDVGKNKAEAACEHLRKLNPFITLHSIPHRITTENIHQFITGADVIIDASDNFETRFILGDYTAQERIPLVFAAIFGFEGQLAVFNYANGRAFRDLYPTLPNYTSIADCTIHGVIGFVPGILGCLQAAEAIKIISGLGTIMSKKLMVIDLLTLDKKEFIINQRDSSKRTERITNETNYNSITMVGEINASDLKHRLDNSPETLFLLDVREPSEFEYFNIGGTLIPLNKLPDRLHEIPDNKDIIVICKSGVRSFKAARYISESRKDVNILNLKGGLMAWLSETDVPKF